MTNQFSEYAIADAAVHHFEKYPDWFWNIRPVTSLDELAMGRFLQHNRIITDTSGAHEYPPVALEVAFREIALSFGGTNIPKDPAKPVADGGEPILPEGAKVEQVEKVLGTLPRPMLMELWAAVGKAYPYWGPADPNAK
jgi:hypothetical protein